MMDEVKMSRRWIRTAPTLTCIGAVLLLTQCAARSPQATEPEHNVRESSVDERPEISWMLSSGNGAAERVLCRSESPDPCVLTNRPGEKPAVVTLHLSLHSTKTDTAYVGSIRIGFGDKPFDNKVDSQVSANGTAANTSVTLLPNPRPGTYSTEISVTATPKGSPAIPLRSTITLQVE